jgi:hypothetical protein
MPLVFGMLIGLLRCRTLLRSTYISTVIFSVCAKTNLCNYKKFWEDVTAHNPMIRHGPNIKRSVQQFYCCMCIRCSGNVFTYPLRSNGKGDTNADTLTHWRGKNSIEGKGSEF